MSKKAIAEIKQAEEKAKKIISDAEYAAGAMILSAEKKAADLMAETEKNAGEELKKTLDAMRLRSAELTEKSLAEAKAEAEELKAKADIKTSSAVKKIIWEIIEA